MTMLPSTMLQMACFQHKSHQTPAHCVSLSTTSKKKPQPRVPWLQQETYSEYNNTKVAWRYQPSRTQTGLA